MKENIGTVQYASMLYDFYGALLKESQLEVMTMYHEDNLSLSEIAEELGMTRQAVHYTLKKAEAKLEEYDNKLGLVANYQENQKRAEQLISKIKDLGIDEAELEPIVKMIEELAE